MRSQRLARAALAATKEQQSEAAGHLANSLIALNHFSSGALSDRLFAGVAHALYLAKTVDHRELEAAAAAVVSSLPRLHDGNSNADLTDTTLAEVTSGFKVRLACFDEFQDDSPQTAHQSNGGAFVAQDAILSLFKVSKYIVDTEFDPSRDERDGSYSRPSISTITDHRLPPHSVTEIESTQRADSLTRL